jgi:hypothetical protein
MAVVRYTPETKDGLLKALEDLPEEMLVEADSDTGISAKNVGELRSNAWSGGLVVVTPREPGRPESTARISRPDSPSMSKITKTASELREMILGEATQHPVCPKGIDVRVRADATYKWKADIISPDQIGWPDCAHHIGAIVQRLRAKYDLQGSE